MGSVQQLSVSSRYTAFHSCPGPSVIMHHGHPSLGTPARCSLNYGHTIVLHYNEWDLGTPNCWISQSCVADVKCSTLVENVRTRFAST
jgi:hypothetical protein